MSRLSPEPVVPDGMNARLLLVGASSFVRGLPPLPAAAADVRDLAQALTGADGLFDPSSLTTLTDPVDAAHVLGPLASYAELTDPLDLLLFYYAGHGVNDEAKRLCLALPGTVDLPQAARRTSLPVDDVVAVMGTVRARHRVVILDCCYAGRALDAPGAADVHLLLACDRTSKASTDPSGEGTTHFTAELLRRLTEGAPDGPSHLLLGDLYRGLAEMLPGRSPLGPPRPLQRAVDLSGDLALARNPAYGTGRTVRGLAVRAREAERTGRAGHARRAAELFGLIADDASQVLPPGRELLRYRRAQAAWTGAAGDPGAAVALLEAVVARLEAGLPEDGRGAGPAGDDDDLRAARASLAHWSARADAVTPGRAPGPG
ncbi:caspase family protein [Streptomyces sp. NPDC005803]|uniref:caspase family protein n=1 Tax=Streptomyces sp. NPDC005803 TaxID=3154297 RepID=UPI0033C5E3A3